MAFPADETRQGPQAVYAVSGGALLAGIAAWLALDHVLLLLFLGIAGPALVLAELGIAAILVWTIRQGGRTLGPIPLQRLALCMAAALVLMLLGGEGRLFCANIDWQVRDAVLRDMGTNPWPFAYLRDGQPILLRAPIGIYLVPALAWKVGGAAVGTAMLVVQDSVLVGALLALGSLLFSTARGRLLALLTLLAFGGIDIVGGRFTGMHPIDHLEGWSPGLQYSSTITSAFWVPHHAIAGWLAGVLFLLQRSGRLELGAFLAILPLTVLWSPLALIGALPWAALAGVEALLARRLRLPDVAVPALATLLALPAAAYLAADAGQVGIHLYKFDPALYVLVLQIEVLRWLIAVGACRGQLRFGLGTLLVAGAVLVILPLIQVGSAIDLMMRGAIPSQTVLGLLTADILAGATRWGRPGWHWFVAAMLALSALTGLHEIRRALVLPAVGGGTCSFFKAWDQEFARYSNDTYIAAVSRVPNWLVGPVLTRVPPAEPARCWDGVWIRPTGTGPSSHAVPSPSELRKDQHER